MVVRGSLPSSALASLRFDMVVDIQPVSRYDTDLPDLASVQSTLVLERGVVLQVSQQVPVFHGDEGYRLDLEVPPEWVQLVKGADFHVLVVMPRSPTNGFELQFDDNELVREFAGAETFSVDVSAVPGGRTLITWTGTIDDPLPVIWDWI